jgi:DNA-directed RNA polymerase specialized sigma24 family protein
MKITEEEAGRLRNVLVATATNLLGSSKGQDHCAEAEDIAHDAIVSILEYNNPAGADDPFSLGSVIVTHLALNHLRNIRNRAQITEEFLPRLLAEFGPRFSGDDPAQVLEAEHLADMWDALSPLLNATVVAHYLDGHGVDHIAAAEDVSADVIYKRLQRARDYVTNGNDYGKAH